MFEMSPQLTWWITMIDLPALGGLFWLIWRTRHENADEIDHLRDVVESRNAQLREALSALNWKSLNPTPPFPICAIWKHGWCRTCCA